LFGAGAIEHLCTSIMAEGRFDDLLLGLASRHGNSEELMYSILSFFERRTDLFHVMETPNERMGFMPGMAEKMFFNQFDHFQQKYTERAQPELLQKAGEAAASDEAAATGETPASSAPAASPAKNEGADAAAPAEATAASSESTAAADASTSAAAGPAGRPKRTEPGGPDEAEPDPEAAEASDAALPESTRKMMRHISTWNGAVTDKYHWSQTIYEVTLEVEVEKDAKAKDVQVDITATRLSIKCKGETQLEGKLHEKVTTDQCVWHLDDNKVVMSLEKQRQTWWKCVLEGDEEIDTTKVESTRTMDEYDGETQGAIRKIMFDQCQKAKGQPTSDQIRTADIMRDAWNAPGSPFRGSDFDPTLLNLSGPVPDDFFEDIEKKRIEESRKSLESQKGGSGSA